MEPLPHWDGVWRGSYRVGYMETPDFTAAEFTLGVFEGLGRKAEGMTHVLQYTSLKAAKGQERDGVTWWKRIPETVRAFLIDTIWNGIDEAIDGVGKGWRIPVDEVVSVGAVAEV
jgi:hypothetical protein